MAYNKETGLYEGFIYKIWNDVNDKIYIGQVSRTIKTRWYEHKTAGKRWNKYKDVDHSVLHKAMYKYGIDKFHIIQIDKVQDTNREKLISKLDELEIEYISQYNTVVPNGYNVSLGGQTPIGCQEYRPVDVYDYDGKLLYEFPSMRSAADILKIDHCAVVFQCIEHRPNKFNRYIIRYHGEKITSEEIEMYKCYNPLIYQYNVKGMILNIFNSSHEAGEYIKNTKCLSTKVEHIGSRIFNACTADNITAYGSIWRKYPDKFNTYQTPTKIIKREELRVEKRDFETGKLLEVFDNLAGVINKYPMYSYGTIQRTCKQSENDSHISAYGFIWNYEGQFNEDNINRVSRKKVYKYSLTGELIDVYDTLLLAAQSVGTNKIASISGCCTGKNKTAYGYIWRHTPLLPNEIDLKHSKPSCGRKIKCYDTEGNLLNIYQNFEEAELNTNVSHAVILHNLNGKSIICSNKYIFRYEGDPFDKYRTQRMY